MPEYVIHFDILSSVIMLIMIGAHYYSPFKNEKLKRVYMELLVTVFLSCIFDIVSSIMIMEGSKDKIFGEIANVVTMLYNMAHLLPLGIFILYVSYCILDSNVTLKKSAIIMAPAIVGELIIITNPITNLAFTIEDGIYNRGPLMYALYGVGVMYVVVALVMLFIFWGRFKNNVRLVIISYCFISFFIMLIQYRFPNLLLECSGMTITLLIVYFTIQNQDSLAEAVKKQEEITKAATEANVAKSEFLANMSHEIRTPISTMLGMNQLIIKEADSLTIKKYAQDVQNAGDTLMTLVDSILDFSKIESGKISVEELPYEIEELVRNSVVEIRKKAATKGIDFNINVDPMIPQSLIGDKMKLYQIIVNLLSNAVEYTDEGFVELRCEYERVSTSELYLRIIVKDTGDGIKEDDLLWLSERYKDSGKGKTKGIEGTGLGLAIVTEMLDILGSRLEVKSKAKVGSEFSFSLKQKIANNTSLGAVNWNKQAIIVTEIGEAFTISDVKALVVDDNEMNLYVMRKLLNNYGIKVVSVENGSDALAASKKIKFDIIFMDYMMPQMDGIETMNAMKHSDEMLSPKAPVIVLTANAMAGIKDRYLSAGFNDYISKPVNKEDLEAILIKYIDSEKIHMN